MTDLQREPLFHLFLPHPSFILGGGVQGGGGLPVECFFERRDGIHILAGSKGAVLIERILGRCGKPHTEVINRNE